MITPKYSQTTHSFTAEKSSWFFVPALGQRQFLFCTGPSIMSLKLQLLHVCLNLSYHELSAPDISPHLSTGYSLRFLIHALQIPVPYTTSPNFSFLLWTAWVTPVFLFWSKPCPSRIEHDWNKLLPSSPCKPILFSAFQAENFILCILISHEKAKRALEDRKLWGVHWQMQQTFIMTIMRPLYSLCIFSCKYKLHQQHFSFKSVSCQTCELKTLRWRLYWLESTFAIIR